MLVITGESLYGKVDQVPGLFYVATRFFYINYIPLVPLGSFVVMEGAEEGEPGRKIGISLKSIVFAWLRMALFVGILSLWAFGGIKAFDVRAGQKPDNGWPLYFVASTGLAFLLWVSYRMTRAKPLRALVMARASGVPPEIVAKYFVFSKDVVALEESRISESRAYASSDSISHNREEQ